MQRSTRLARWAVNAAPALAAAALAAFTASACRRLTGARTRPYRGRMDNAAALAQLRALAARVEALVERTQRLTDENRSLRHQQEQLIGERAAADQERTGTLARGSHDRAIEVTGAAHVSNEPVSVRILDREYTVGVTAEERESLTAAARLLDLRMREIRGSNRMAAVDRVAVLAALNLAHELQQLREQQAVYERELANTLDSMNRRLDGVIDTPR